MNDILGGSQILGLLSPELQAQAEQRARSAGLTNLGFALLQASQGQPGQRRPGLGQIIGQAGPVGMQAYQQSFDRTLQDMLRAQQIQDLQKQRAQRETAQTRQSAIQAAMQLPDMNTRIDTLRKLGAFPELQAMAGAEKAIRPLTRQAGEAGMENPFMVYQQSEIPGVKKLAEQYAKSYEAGNIDDEKANARLGELARMEQTATSTRESREQQKLTRDQMAVDRQIAREAQQTERDLKRSEGTEGQRLAAGFASRMEAANRIVEQLEPAGGLPTEFTSAVASIPFLGGYAQRQAMSPEQQKYKQAADNWIRANLRKESGAVIGADEMAAEYATYFPQPGDTPEVIAQKAEARRITTDAMKQNAGPVYRPTQGATRPNLGNIRSNYGLE
jgi:hypothetical protein